MNKYNLASLTEKYANLNWNYSTLSVLWCNLCLTAGLWSLTLVPVRAYKAYLWACNTLSLVLITAFQCSDRLWLFYQIVWFWSCSVPNRSKKFITIQQRRCIWVRRRHSGWTCPDGIRRDSLVPSSWNLASLSQLHQRSRLVEFGLHPWWDVVRKGSFPWCINIEPDWAYHGWPA